MATPHFPQLGPLRIFIRRQTRRLNTRSISLCDSSIVRPSSRRFYGAATIRSYLETLVHKRGEAAQPEIDQALNFLRGAEFTFPQVLRALNDILDAVVDGEAAEYRAYAQQLQNLFLSPGLRGLDEFGVPIPLVAKLGLDATDDIRTLLREVSSPDFAGRRNLSAFENELLSASVGRV
jgi:hypothetical protein